MLVGQHGGWRKDGLMDSESNWLTFLNVVFLSYNMLSILASF